jgi:hypothetical protein
LLSFDSDVEVLEGNRLPESPDEAVEEDAAVAVLEEEEARGARRPVSATVGRISTQGASGDRMDISSESVRDLSDFSLDSTVDSGVEWSDLPLSEPLALAWRSSRHLCGPRPARR